MTATSRTDRRRLTVPTGRELRLTDLTAIEVRAAGEGEPIGFKGHAAVFDKRTRIGSSAFGWFEEIAPGTFANSIASDDIRMLKNHNTDLPLARNTTGSLRLAEDEIGLAVDADMDPTTYAKDLAISLQRGTVSQMSFAFDKAVDEWITLADDDPDKGKVVEPELRRVTSVRLWEASPVTFPAYTDTDASLRMRDLETLARSLELDDDQLHELAAELRTNSNLDLTRLLASRRASSAPASEPTVRRRRAADLFPTVFA